MKVVKQDLNFSSHQCLQKVDNIFDQILDYIDKNERVLKTKGFLRESGNKEMVDQLLTKMIKNPKKNVLVQPQNNAFFNFEHNLASLLKATLNTMTIPSNTNDIFQKFIENIESPEFNYDGLINDLKRKNAFLEAKIIHNVLYLCLKVEKYKNYNGMDSKNIAITLGQKLYDFIQSLATGQSMDIGISAREYAANLAKHQAKIIQIFQPQYQKRFTSRFSNNQPVNLFGLALPLWLSNFLNKIRFLILSILPKSQKNVSDQNPKEAPKKRVEQKPATMVILQQPLAPVDKEELLAHKIPSLTQQFSAQQSKKQSSLLTRFGDKVKKGINRLK